MRLPHLRLMVRLAWVTALAASISFSATATDYPNKPIRMVIPFAAGGTTDLLARGIAQHLSQAWGQPVISDNRPGANGQIAANIVATAPGDGYTLSVVAMGHAINPLIYRNLPFDSDKDFTPISLVATFPQLVLVHPSVPAKSVGELIALAKRTPGKLTYASGGNGSSQHLAGALFTHMSGIDMVHVPFKGGAPALHALLGGNVDMMLIQPSSREQVTSGQLRALAVSSSDRSRHYPDIPTVNEEGVKGFQAVAWYGVIGPKDIPADVLRKISEEVNKAIHSPAVRSVVDSQGGDLAASSPQEFAAFIASERQRYEAIVKAAGIVVD